MTEVVAEIQCSPSQLTMADQSMLQSLISLFKVYFLALFYLYVVYNTVPSTCLIKSPRKKKENLSNNDWGRRKQSMKFNFLSVKFKLDLLNPKRDKTLTDHRSKPNRNCRKRKFIVLKKKKKNKNTYKYKVEKRKKQHLLYYHFFSHFTTLKP